MREFLTKSFKYTIKTIHIINIELRLPVFQINGISISHHPVAIPLDKCNSRIFCKHPVNYIKHKILNFWICKIENELVPEVILGTVWQLKDPVWMIFIKFTFWTDHFRFYPDAKFYTGTISFPDKITQSIGQLCFIFLPVTKTCAVVIPWIFVGKPSIIQEEEIKAQLFCIIQ